MSSALLVGLQLNASGGLELPFRGELAALLLYDRALGAADVAALSNHFAPRFGWPVAGKWLPREWDTACSTSAYNQPPSRVDATSSATAADNNLLSGNASGQAAGGSILVDGDLRLVDGPDRKSVV